MRLIDADKLKKAFCSHCYGEVPCTEPCIDIDLIETAPTIDADEKRIEVLQKLVDINTERCEALRKQLREAHENYEKHLNELEAQIPKEGKWIPCIKCGLPLTEMMRREGQKWYGFKCSNCKYIYKGNALRDCNYCPNCGSVMKGEQENE